MNNTSYGFLSPLLAQKKLLKFIAPKKQTFNFPDIIESKSCKKVMNNITTKPNFHNSLPCANEGNLNIPVSVFKEILARAYKRAFEKTLNSEEGYQTLIKAIRYNIPFDSSDIDFLDLMDKISDYEYLLERAAELSVDWDESNYDIAELQEELQIASSDPERVSNDYNELRRDYYASIAL